MALIHKTIISKSLAPAIRAKLEEELIKPLIGKHGIPTEFEKMLADPMANYNALRQYLLHTIIPMELVYSRKTSMEETSIMADTKEYECSHMSSLTRTQDKQEYTDMKTTTCKIPH